MSKFLRWSRADDRALDDPRISAAEGGLPQSVVDDARRIIAAVRAEGDRALVELTERYDKVKLEQSTLKVSAPELAESAAKAEPELRAAIDTAILNVRAFHERQRPNSFSFMSPEGAELGWNWQAVDSAALYVPGGSAAYPSSVIMNGVPALIAGVERVAVFTVPGTIEDNPAVAYALQALGLDEVWRVGGAQAIAAAAWGTEQVEPVDVIVGPGNAWVAAAKREVYGRVGIDSIAGPSEVLILVDDSSPVDWVALDLIAQAEHDPLARVIVASESAAVLEAVAAGVDSRLESAARRDIAASAWRDHGALVEVSSREELIALTNHIAPEHLQVMLSDPPSPNQLKAGAIFMGAHSPTALGDYIAGPNHVLPTGGSARFAGPLSVHTFLRASSYLRSTPRANAMLASRAALLADHERLHAHAAALRARASEAAEHSDSDHAAAAALANITPEVRGLAPYTLKATVAEIKLNQNESPWPPADELRREVMEAVEARPWNRYPDFHPEDILQGIGERHGLGAGNVLIGNGSNELIQASLLALVTPGQQVAFPQPTFALYEMMTRACGGQPLPVPLDESLQYQAEPWLEIARRGQAHLLICSPNNPTGSLMPMELIDELCATTPRMVIVDEAYAPFGPQDASALLKKHANLIVLRTFSKAAGLAGIRLGYALAHAAVAEQIHKVKLPYNVGLLGLEVARAALRAPEVFEGQAERLRQLRSDLEAALRQLPLKRVVGGAANFVLIQVDRPSELAATLLERKVLVRDVSSAPGLSGFLRLSVGSPEENDRLIAALRVCLNGGSDGT